MKKIESGKLLKKNIIIIFGLSVMAIIFSVYFFLHTDGDNTQINHEIVFVLNGEFEQEIEVFSEYLDPGAMVSVDNAYKSNELKIDTNNLNTNKVGEYKIKYYIIIDGKEYSSYRIVRVIDSTKPVISLDGNNELIILFNENFEEPGYKAIDNYDGDITDNVIIENNIDNTRAGEYIVKYTVTDSSGNEFTVQRTVKVKKPNIVTTASNQENKMDVQKVIETNYSNTITKNNFTTNGIYIEGYVKDNNGKYKIKFGENEDYSFDLISNGENNYKGNIDLTSIPNGEYTIYIVSNNQQRLINKMDYIEKIVRSKVGNKLVTFSYINDEVTMKLEDFQYLYDILIDPGHGGTDFGASNEYIYEKEINLAVSLYEKCRYESHGLNVYMTRTSDTYGNGLGATFLSRLHRRAYEIGYYGAVSKIIYSNHHNSSNDKTYSGYEILLPGYLTLEEMTDELEIISKFNNIYPIMEIHPRFYAKDYDTEVVYSKLGGSIYYFKDNYAVNRIPHELFNVKSIIFEGTYISNKKDYDWYWNKENWISVSEAKIETYVKSLGATYNSDNSSCLYN